MNTYWVTVISYEIGLAGFESQTGVSEIKKEMYRIIECLLSGGLRGLE